MLINTGRTWCDDTEMGVWIVDRLATIDTAALVVALGHFLDEVPEPVVERALRHKMPVLTLPPGAKTREVLGYVYHALSSADLHRLRRTVAMQNDLLDFLLAEAGADELVAKVSWLLGMPMLLLDGTGSIVYNHGVGVPAAAPRRSGRPGTSSPTPTRWASSRSETRGTSAARCCCTARWSGSSWPRPPARRARCSSTWR